jgi:hypothetical protein
MSLALRVRPEHASVIFHQSSYSGSGDISFARLVTAETDLVGEVGSVAPEQAASVEPIDTMLAMVTTVLRAARQQVRV